MIKLIALDMDGTLLNDQHTISQHNQIALKKAIQKGVHVVLCTGRPLFGVTPFVKQLDLKDGYIIVNNGCATHRINTSWDLINWSQLTKQDICYLNQFADGKDIQLTLFDEKHYFFVSDKANEYVKKDADLVYVTTTPLTFDQAISGEYTLFQGMFVGAPEAVDMFQSKHEKALSEKFSTVRSQNYIFETMPYGVNKASAIEKLAKQLHVQPHEIMAIGDGNNDIEMLKMAHLGVAMGNARPEVKAIANVQTDTNNQDGVAKAIYQYVLEEEKP